MTGTGQSTSSRIRSHSRQVRNVYLSFAGILLFAGFIHHPFPLKLIAFGGLAWTAAVIGLSTRNTSLQAAFGTEMPERITLYYIPAALILGTVLALFTRNRFELTLVPEGLTGVAIIAPLVGSAEELVFRGYIQGQLRPAGKLFSIISASAFHCCYKLLVILTLSTPLEFDFFFLIFWTFVGGILFGFLREASRSTIPPVIAHGLFDVILYGGLATAPVWVWS